MITLDKQPINVNDTVYDLVYGNGTVTSASDKNITVKFNNGRQILFQTGGYINDVRRLFWHNPIIIAPPKNKTTWNKFIPIILNVYNIVISE